MLDNTNLIKLLSLYLKDELFEWDIEYILNALDFADVESSAKAQEVIFTISTPEVNYFINQEFIKNCIDFLAGKIDNLNTEQIKKNTNFAHYRTVFS